MKVHEQRDALAKAIEVALSSFSGGPTLAAFGIAREDCALAHIDYFGGVNVGAMHLANILAETRGSTTAEIWAQFGPPTLPCDCRACVNEEEHAKALARHRAAYTNVKEWKEL